MQRQEDARLVGAINQQRCVTIALASIVAAMAHKAGITATEAHKQIRSCHIYGEELVQQPATIAAVEKIVGQILGEV